MKTTQQSVGLSPRAVGAFTLLEVMIAMGLFFIAIFAVLDATAQAIRAAKSLQVNVPDVGNLAADLFLTNTFEEGFQSGDFGDLYPGFEWTREISPVTTNGLFRADFKIVGQVNGHPYEYESSVLLWNASAAQVRPGLRR